ncbi:phosphotransferase [Arcobacter roscoffensis]|uniref:Choline kinase family protein n=1 Tax=Arcobacter roscoffensis TaxID=2961520 RepID=A0ABY5E5J8_9BACT|nr:phosphotransferase [Arcobacter roscoffensis]UTJ07429.1 choline kinase family protein [Arcobacter roscoffensis]
MNIKKLKEYKLFGNQELLDLKILENQGVCNTIYKLQTSKKTYSIRVFKHTHTQKKKREIEFKIQNKAYKKDIGAKAYILDKKNSLMICDFIKGEHKEKLTKANIKAVVKTLKKLHSIKIKKKPYDLKKDFKNYEKLFKDRKIKTLAKESLKQLHTLKRYKKDLVLCHHDLNQKNILFNQNKAFFIDWEFACINDRFFDLAALCIEFKLNDKQEKYLLKEYFKKVKKEHKEKLKAYKKICTNLWILWFEALKK